MPSNRSANACVLLLSVSVSLLLLGKPRLIGPTALLNQKVCMFWDNRRAEAFHRPMQALTIEHSFGLMRQCCAWEAEKWSSALTPLELFTATALPALRSLVPVRGTPQATAPHLHQPAPG